MQAGHWSLKASDLVFLSSGEDLKGSVVQDVRTKGYILPQNAGLSVLTNFYFIFFKPVVSLSCVIASRHQGVQCLCIIEHQKK